MFYVALAIFIAPLLLILVLFFMRRALDDPGSSSIETVRPGDERLEAPVGADPEELDKVAEKERLKIDRALGGLLLLMRSPFRRWWV
jgi:hypothetical protein